MTLDIRRVIGADEEAWSTLYAGYRSFYSLEDDASTVRRTWEWVSQGRYGLTGLVAVLDGSVVGLVNLRRFARPSTATIGLYLDDLFTAPEARGAGVASGLLREAAAVAAAEGASVVRWITAADNAVARRVYDGVATATAWVTYDMKPSATG